MRTSASATGRSMEASKTLDLQQHREREKHSPLRSPETPARLAIAIAPNRESTGASTVLSRAETGNWRDNGHLQCEPASGREADAKCEDR